MLSPALGNWTTCGRCSTRIPIIPTFSTKSTNGPARDLPGLPSAGRPTFYCHAKTPIFLFLSCFSGAIQFWRLSNLLRCYHLRQE